MKVSVITAVRNAESTIAATIRSVAAQSHPGIEHVFVDGASTDGTKAAILSTCGRSAILISERDAGVYDAFNKGLKLATGEVIGYLNAADTYADETVIERIVQRFESSDVDAVFGDVAIVDQHDSARVVRRYRSARFAPGRIGYGFMPAHPTLFLRRSAYERWGGYDASYRIAGDFELVARMFGRGKLAYTYLPEVLAIMPRGGLSTSGWRSKWIITQEMRRACMQNAIRTSYLRLMLRFPVKLTELIS